MKKILSALRPHCCASRPLRVFYSLFFVVITLFLTACDEQQPASINLTLNENNDLGFYAISSSTSRVVITDAYLNANHELIITGFNFTSGDLPEPQVNLDGSALNLIEYSANEIKAELTGEDDLDANYLLTVTTGNALAMFDPHALFHVDAELGDQLSQLLIVSVETVNEPSQVKLNIEGYNFDQGNWPPDVVINDIPIVVDVANSHAEQLVIIIPEHIVTDILNMPGDIKLVVQTATTHEQYDAYPLFKGLLEKNPPLLACNITNLTKAPVAGEHCCTTSGQNLCWSTGPIREDIRNFLFHYDEIPRYFELTEDYIMPIAHYFDNPPPVAFPDFWRVIGDGDPDTRRQRLINAGLLSSLPLLFSTKVESIINKRKWDFVSYSNGTLTIKKGYRWDGASIGIDFNEWDDRLRRTYLVNMRSSLVHDVFYDLIRICHDTNAEFGLTCNKTNKAPINGGKEDYRDLADTLFYLTAKQDGQSKKLKTFFKTLRRLGQTKSDLHPEYKTGWRFHSLANAMASFSDNQLVIGSEGNKTLSLACATESDAIVLDASNTWPIATQPKAGTHQANLHDTSWQWTLDSTLLNQGTHEYPTGDLNNQPNKFKTSLTVSQLINAGLIPGNEHLLTLFIDKGKNTLEATFETQDVIKLKVAFDTEPPIITGITEALLVWPPNHKYKTYHIEDFVSSVSDDCTDLSLDDLIITQVTSNEADDAKGDGHTVNDIIISADGKSVDLRTERQGGGDGRIYTIYIQAVDERGNVKIADYEVQVPHNR